MKLTAVLFDFDGTLVDTTELIYQSLRHATREVLGREIPRETLMAGVGQPLPYQMELLLGRDPENSGEDPTDLARELLDSYRVHNEAHHDELIREFPNVEASLSRLQDAGTKLAVVTSKRCPSVRMALDSFPRPRDGGRPLRDHGGHHRAQTAPRPRCSKASKSSATSRGKRPPTSAILRTT